MTPSIVLLGNLLVDDVVFADGRTRMGQPGGAILYGALGATLWDARPGLVSPVGDDYPGSTLRILQQRGADLRGLRGLGRPGVRTWLLYEGDLRRLIHRLGCPTHEQVSPQPQDIPNDWLDAPACHLAPMPFELQRSLLHTLCRTPAPFVSIDPYLEVTEETLSDWRDVLADADAFFPGEDELLLEGVQTDPERVLPRLVNGRLRFVVFKRGRKGGVLYDAHQARFHTWIARAESVVDQTGAGDAFATGFVCAYLEGLSVEACVQRAVVTASVAVEGWGADALFCTRRNEAEARLQQWYGGKESQVVGEKS